MFLPLPARPTPGSSGPVSSLLSPGRIPHLCKCGDKEWGAARPGSAVGSKRGAKLGVCVRLRERRGEVAEGRKGSPDPGGDAERLPGEGGCFTKAQGRVQTPLPISFQGTKTCGDRGRISWAHSLIVSFHYLPFLPAQSLVLFKVCGSCEFVQFFLGFEDPKKGTARCCFWSRQLPCWQT